MKKLMILMTAVMLAVFLCSCGEPVEVTNAGMSCTLPRGLTLVEDKEEAVKNWEEARRSIGTEASDNDGKVGADDLIDLTWLTGNEYDVSISSIQVPYTNSEFADCYTALYPDDPGTYTDFTTPGGVKGRHGAYSIGFMSRTCSIECLHDGIYYTMSFYMRNKDDEVDEETINEIIDSMVFNDYSLEPLTVSCGDISVTLPGEYQELKANKMEGAEDRSAFGRFDDDEVEFSINYFDRSIYVSSGEMADILNESLGSPEIEHEGDIYYMDGTYEGSSEVIALYEKNGKVYMFDLYSETVDLTVDDMKAITSTIS